MLTLLVVCTESPIPAHHGGRVDVLRRLEALRACGARIAMVSTWGAESERLAGERALAQALPGTRIDLMGIGQTTWARLKRWPALLCSRASMQVQIRTPSRERWRRTLAMARDCDASVVMADGIFSVPLARRLAGSLGLPWVYRAHNIEFQYLQRQAQLARGWRLRLTSHLAARGVEALEREAHQHADLVLDISLDDLAWWRSQPPMGPSAWAPSRWLPPYGPAGNFVAADGPVEFDLGFLGNLRMPNNVDGLAWFLREVWPRIRQGLPQARCLVAGSQPGADLVAQCRRTPGVTLEADVPDAAAVYARARAWVNPTRHGSGVNLKALELLATGKPVVSRSQGVAGLPAAHQALFEVADTAEGFARACLLALETARLEGGPSTSRLPPCYQPQAAHELIGWLQALRPQGGGRA